MQFQIPFLLSAQPLLNNKLTLGDLSEIDKLLLLARHRGILRRVAVATNKSLSTVSRVFWGRVKRSDEVSNVLNREIGRLPVQPLHAQQ